MNKYILIDLENNNIYSLNKVKFDYKENENYTSSTACTDKEDLCDIGIEWLNEIKINDLKEQLKYLEDKINVCAYGKRELQEIESLKYRINEIEENF